MGTPDSRRLGVALPAIEENDRLDLPNIEAEAPQWRPGGHAEPSPRAAAHSARSFAAGRGPRRPNPVVLEAVGERRLARAEASVRGDLLSQLGTAVSAEMALLDHCGVIVSVNAAWREAATQGGPGAATGLGRSYLEVCRWLVPELEARVAETALAELLSGQSQSFVHTCERPGPQGPRWRQVRITRLRVGADVHIVATHEDLTEVARAQAALRDTSEQLLSAQEDERHRIAIELHDSTTQHLVALGLGLKNLRRLTGQGGRTDEILEDMSKSLKEAMKEIRVLSYLMKPPAVEREGLAAHAGRFVAGFGTRTGLLTHFNAYGPVDAFDLGVQHTVFRVIQEALANVYKHAHARSVVVNLTSRNGGLEARIADDGKGIRGLANGTLADVPLGVGIAGMRSRMAQLGGELRIESDENGAIVTARLPPAVGRLTAAQGRARYA